MTTRPGQVADAAAPEDTRPVSEAPENERIYGPWPLPEKVDGSIAAAIVSLTWGMKRGVPQ